jgi:L-fucose mutarotase
MVPPAAEPEPEAIREYRDRLESVPFEELDRFAFYAQARSDDLALLIVTADVRTYANLLLTLGVRSN